MKLLNDAQCRSEICDRLSKVRPDTPARWGRMRCGQMVCHLNDAFLGVMGERPIAPIEGLNLWPLMRWFVLYAPIAWPKGVPTRPEIDQTLGGTPPMEFSADMQKLLTLIERFTASKRDFSFQRHPMFGVMSEKDWMRWGYLHADHHLRQFGA